MKKFFSLLIGTLVCVPAVAQAEVSTLYIAGAEGTIINGQTLGAWDIANPVEVNAENACFTLDCQNVQQYGFGISDMKTSDWAEWPQHRYGPSEAYTKADLGKDLQLFGPGAADFKPLWEGDWKLVISQDLSSIVVTSSTAPVAATYHLVGNFNEFATEDTYEFQPEEGVDNIYWLDITTPITTQFANILRNKGWSEWWAPAASPITMDVPGEWNWGANPAGEAIALTDYSGTMRLEVPAAITGGCTVNVICYSTIKEHKTDFSGIVMSPGYAEACERAEYFNLQGMKVETPQNGIYVVRRGNKVTKELIR